MNMATFVMNTRLRALESPIRLFSRTNTPTKWFPTIPGTTSVNILLKIDLGYPGSTDKIYPEPSNLADAAGQLGC